MTGICAGGTVVFAGLDDARALLLAVFGSEDSARNRQAAEGQHSGDGRTKFRVMLCH
jgi:hypothetical protein